MVDQPFSHALSRSPQDGAKSYFGLQEMALFFLLCYWFPCFTSNRSMNPFLVKLEQRKAHQKNELNITSLREETK
jgi:hypothetical protein